MKFTLSHDVKINLLAALAILAAISGIAYADRLIAEELSLGYLYLLPLVFSALMHPLWATGLLAFACVVLRELFGPFGSFERQWFTRDLILLSTYFVVIVLAHRLGEQRRNLYDTIRQQRDTLTKEIELAAKVQRRLLVQEIPKLPDLEISVRLQPANIVSGDYYDFIPGKGGVLGIVIADVSGKGVPAALLMAAIQTALRLVVETSSSTAEVVTKLNRILCELTETENYVTLFYGRLDAKTGLLEYTNAGHHSPLLMKANASQPLWLQKGGPVVGMLPQAVFESGVISLAPEDLLVLYTDGLVEAENTIGEGYGSNRLLSVVRTQTGRSTDTVAHAICQSLREWATSGSFVDDATVIVMRLRHLTP